MGKVNEWRMKLDSIRQSLFALQGEIYQYADSQGVKWYELGLKYPVKYADISLGAVDFAIENLPDKLRGQNL